MVSHNAPSSVPHPVRRSRNRNGAVDNSAYFRENCTEVLSIGAGEGSGDVLPDHVSWSNSVSCPSVFCVMCSHLLDHSNLFHKEAGACALKPGALSCGTQILTRAAPTNHIHRWQIRTIELCDIAKLKHIRETDLTDFHGKRFDFTGPHRDEALTGSGQRKASDPIEQAAHGEWDAHVFIFMPKSGTSSGMTSLSFGKYSTVLLTDPNSSLSRLASAAASS